MAKFLKEANEEMAEHHTKGKFTRLAHKAGKSVQKYAQEKKHAGGKLGKEANFAANMKKIASRRKHGG